MNTNKGIGIIIVPTLGGFLGGNIDWKKALHPEESTNKEIKIPIKTKTPGKAKP